VITIRQQSGKPLCWVVTATENPTPPYLFNQSNMDALFQLLPHLVNGISLGLLFALIALGFMLIVGVMETINLAHGSLFALGMYFALFFVSPRLGWFPELQAAYMGLPLETRYLVALFLAPIFVGLFGMLLELCMRRTYGRDPLYGLLLTFGAALVIEEGIRLIWGSTEKQLLLPPAISGAFMLGDLIYSKYRLFASGFAVLMILALWLFLEKTPYGAIIKAGAHDSEMVRVLGINLPRLRLFVFAIGVALAAIAGVVMAPIWGIRPHVGVDAVVPAFLIIVLGGVGSLWGAVIAGLMVGMVVGLTGAYASEWSLVSMYILFIAVVTFRSRGLFGKKSVLDV
jgi:branched-chain amino acid transport system permease protein